MADFDWERLAKIVSGISSWAGAPVSLRIDIPLSPDGETSRRPSLLREYAALEAARDARLAALIAEALVRQKQGYPTRSDEIVAIYDNWTVEERARYRTHKALFKAIADKLIATTGSSRGLGARAMRSALNGRLR